jgi:UDP-2,3-diacylglucosamine pyrophosphatase LpxH
MSTDATIPSPAPAPAPEPDSDGRPAAPGPRYDCLVLSDLHLGSAVCQAALLEEFLLWAVDHTHVLVINGDIFDDLNFKRLTKRHFACLKVIRRNSDRPDLRLVWIRGNHDGPADIISHIVGVPILDEYIFENGQVRLLIIHGDQFDTFVTHYGWLTGAAIWFFRWFQKAVPHSAARWVRRISKRWQRNSQKVERGAIDYARNMGFTHVTCGHTHRALTDVQGGVHYYNTGSWTDRPPCGFLAVDGDRVELKWWPPAAPDESPISPAAEAASVPPRPSSPEAIAQATAGNIR